MDTNFYDVVVCGGELAGLVAGALLARRGLRVLTVGHEGDEPAFEVAGRSLSRAPALLPPLDEAPAGRVFRELDIVALVRRRAPASRPALRVVTPGQKLDLPPAASGDLGPELARAFGTAGPTIAKAVDRLGALSRLIDPLLASGIALPPLGFWERREVGRLESLLPRPTDDLLVPLAAEHPFRAVASAPAVATAALVPHEIGPVAEARAFDLARRGLGVFEGGLARLHDLIRERYETFGGDRRERLTPVEILVRRGRVAAVRVRPGDETIGCHSLIWAGPAAGLRAALGSAAPATGPGRRRAHPLRVAGYRYTIALLVGPGAIPDGTPARILAIGNPARPLTEDNAVAITLDLPPAGAPPPAETAIWIECVVPTLGVDAGPGYLRALRGRLLHTLGRLLPEVPRRMLLAASPFDGLPPEGPAATGSTATGGGASGSSGPPGAGTAAARVAVSPPPVYALPVPRALDLFGSPQATGIRNLHLAGRENLPGLGLEGELVAGWGAARLVASEAGRRHLPQRRRMLLG